MNLFLVLTFLTLLLYPRYIVSRPVRRFRPWRRWLHLITVHQLLKVVIIVLNHRGWPGFPACSRGVPNKYPPSPPSPRHSLAASFIFRTCDDVHSASNVSVRFYTLSAERMWLIDPSVGASGGTTSICPSVSASGGTISICPNIARRCASKRSCL